MLLNSGEVLLTLNIIDKFLNRAFHDRYVTSKLNFKDVLLDRDKNYA